MRNKVIFLDRDGVINYDPGDYTFKLEEFILEDGVPEALKLLKQAGFKLVVVTNQAGIAKGIYSKKEVDACHQKLQNATHNAIDTFFYSPYHPEYDSASLGRKPGSLFYERGAALYQADISASWAIGDKLRDLEAANQIGIPNLVLIRDKQLESEFPTMLSNSLLHAVQTYILA